MKTEVGSTLIISLIVLIILMLLGVMAMNASGTQFKLAANLHFDNVAINNAETAEKSAEHWLEDHAATLPSASSVAAIDPLSMAWSESDTVQSVAITAPDGTPDERQRYVIGYVGTNASPLAGVGLDCTDPANEKNYDCVNTYLITARGQGSRGAVKYIQVYYAVPLK
jgi:Tfp pilus assembly protein PilX